jgi:hypothetical protein
VLIGKLWQAIALNHPYPSLLILDLAAQVRSLVPQLIKTMTYEMQRSRNNNMETLWRLNIYNLAAFNFPPINLPYINDRPLLI